ncbi:MAG: amidohydrolase family protein [Chloroflexi bacterium]|nr:amidohydrolase family protein [Chloroflexota bacterium]
MQHGSGTNLWSKGIAFLDANCQIGRYNHRPAGNPYSVEDLLADTADQGIARRLVYHAIAKEHDVALGNNRLMTETAGHSELLPCWTVSTWVTGEIPAPDVLVAQMAELGVRAVRFFRCHYAVPMAEWSLGPLWSALEVHRVPLLLDVGERWATMDTFDAEEVYRLCHDHPNLPVILVKHRIRFNRQLYQLLNACPNLRFELSGYWHYRAVEEIASRFGPERMVFGTNWPHMDSSFAIAMVMYAAVSDEVKVAVAGGNLADLMEGVGW